MNPHFIKNYSLILEVIYRGETNDRYLYKKSGYDSFWETESQQVISVNAKGSCDWWLVNNSDSGSEYTSLGMAELDFGGDNEFTPHFDNEKFAIYMKKFVTLQEVIFKIALPDDISFEEALRIFDDKGREELFNHCGISNLRSSSLGDPTFDSFGDTEYRANDNEVWEAKRYREPIKPIKLDYLKVLEHAEANEWEVRLADRDDWDD